MGWTTGATGRVAAWYDLRMSEPDEPVPSLPDAPQGLLADFWDFLVHEKAWWMTPIVLVLLAMVGFILYAEASPVLPFIYAL